MSSVCLLKRRISMIYALLAMLSSVTLKSDAIIICLGLMKIELWHRL